VAEQKRRNAGAEPISRHPLFPAIVALWFGALFGLGSIMISPSVIERLVLTAGIDRVIPMAAPPLGTTTRILLALAATGLGAVIGFFAARRLARPAAAPERHDDTLESGESVDFAPADAVEAPRPGRIAGRRRALALNTQDDVSTFEDRAPIPGHEAPSHDPQILNVAEFDLDGFEDPAPAAPVFRPHLPAIAIDEAEADAALPAWLDAESAWHEPEPAWTAPEAEWAEPELEPDLAPLAEPRFAGNDADPAPFAPAGAQVFQQVFEARLAEDAAAQTAPGFKLLPRLHSAEPVEVEADVEMEAARDLEVQDELEAPADEASAEVEDAPEPEVAEQAAAPVLESRTARRIAEADLDDLSPVELLERLALAMAERRQQARLAAEAAEAAALIASAPVAVQFTPLREVPPSPAPSPSSAPYAPTFERLGPGPFAAPAPFAAPVVDSELQTHETVIAPAHECWGEHAPAASFVPAGLRPVAFDDFAADEPLPGYVPPRALGLAAVDTAAEFAPFPASPFAAEEAEADEDIALTQGYSSLLNLSRHAAPRQNFARAIQFEHEDDIEADAPAAEVSGEPVRDAVPFGRPTLASAPQSGPQSAPVTPNRLFDAPASGEAPDQDATERALRAALATLQRMSGAA
jgi:hypothetical protein